MNDPITAPRPPAASPKGVQPRRVLPIAIPVLLAVASGGTAAAAVAANSGPDVALGFAVGLVVLALGGWLISERAINRSTRDPVSEHTCK